MKKLIYYILILITVFGMGTLALYSLAGISEVTTLKVIAGVCALIGGTPLLINALFLGKIFKDRD